MKTDRRQFLKLTGMAGVAGAAVLSGCEAQAEGGQSSRDHRQSFNMAGYAAPKIDLVRVGIIGMGSRGSGHLRRFARIEGVEVRAICDVEPEAVEASLATANRDGDFPYKPDTYSGAEDEWKKLCERDDIDLIFNSTPWHLHTPIAVYAMEHGKHVAVEIPAAKTVEECWQLVETSERTRKHCLQMTNICYGFFEMVTLNMARQGFFGDIIHGEGAYIHQLLMSHNFSKTAYHDMWRLKENASRNGNLYPHHGLGTVSQIMGINRGVDKMEYMVSVSSNDFMMGKMAKELAETDPFFEEFADETYRGNMNISTIRTNKGRTIMLQHDVTTPRPYSRIHLVSGTKAVARAFPEPMIATSHDGWLSEEEFKAVEEQYTPEITKKVGEMARRAGGHGGADYLLSWRLVDCLRNGLPVDLDVYDAATWSAIGPLSEWSVANRSNSIDVPDFTSGSWQTNPVSMDINLQHGGTTQVI